MKRYIRVTNKIPVANAIDIRRLQLEDLAARAKSIEEELVQLLNTPLQTEVTFQREVLHGEEGYESASPVFDPALYVGEMKWIKK